MIHIVYKRIVLYNCLVTWVDPQVSASRENSSKEVAAETQGYQGVCSKETSYQKVEASEGAEDNDWSYKLQFRKFLCLKPS